MFKVEITYNNHSSNYQGIFETSTKAEAKAFALEVARKLFIIDPPRPWTNFWHERLLLETDGEILLFTDNSSANGIDIDELFPDVEFQLIH